MVWQNGPLFGILIFIGAPVGMILLYLVSGKVRQATTYTIPELFELRYGTTARAIATVCIVLGYIGILASQFMAAGNIVNLVTGIDIKTATIICGILIVILAVTGGMVSVAYTDAMSAFLIVGGFLIAIPMLSGQIDGDFFEMFASLPEGKNTFSGNLNVIQAIGYVFPILFLVLGEFFPDILSVQMYAYSMYGASITPALVCALFSKNVTKAGGLAGILGGGISTIIWEVVLKSPFGIKSAIITVPFSFALIFIVSYFTKNGSKVALEEVYVKKAE